MRTDTAKNVRVLRVQCFCPDVINAEFGQDRCAEDACFTVVTDCNDSAHEVGKTDVAQRFDVGCIRTHDLRKTPGEPLHDIGA